ncbi:MAG: enoyl-CoA hydratase/isomerase family protein [Flavobacteriaceae bacterium]|nr:enoyl-CoA hydratase/isomerase family protein [Flavobacteriaceae bacterium]
MTTRNNGSLYTNIQNHLATIEFGHPASNSFPLELLDRLTEAFQQLSDKPEVHAIVLKSEGEKAFCAGASFNELIAIENLSQGKSFFMGFANAINAIRNCRKPIIARVQGKAVGGGVGLIAACDYAIATEGASIKLSELTIGIGPFVIEPAVSRKIGIAAFTQLSLAATQWKNAYWAQEKGLYAQVMPNIEELDKEVDHLAAKLCSYNPEATQELKTTLWQGTSNWDTLLAQRAEISGKLVLSDFTRNALNQFKK